MKVAFQGERGAYSESAVFQFFGADTEVKPCRGFKDVLTAYALRRPSTVSCPLRTAWRAA